MFSVGSCKSFNHSAAEGQAEIRPTGRKEERKRKELKPEEGEAEGVDREREREQTHTSNDTLPDITELCPEARLLLDLDAT